MTRTVGSSLVALGLLSGGVGCSEGNVDPAPVGGGSGGATSSGGRSGATAMGGSGGSSAGGTPGNSGSGGGSAVTPLRTFAFAENIEGWVFVYAEPPELIAAPAPAVGDAGADAGPPQPVPEGVATAAHDPAVGNPDNGSILLELPFSAPSQKISFEVNVASGGVGIDLAGRSITAQVRIDMGLALDTMNPAGVKLYVKTGDTSLYADSGFQNILPGVEWQTFTWQNVSTPTYPLPPATGHTPTDVRQVGIEFATGGAGTYAAATVHLDTVVY